MGRATAVVLAVGRALVLEIKQIKPAATPQVLMGVKGHSEGFPLRELETSVKRIWCENGLSPSTVDTYLWWVKQYYEDSLTRERDPESNLTQRMAVDFAAHYADQRGLELSRVREAVRKALHAWSLALRNLGRALPSWAPHPRPRQSPTILRTYGEYRRRYGVATATLRSETDRLRHFLSWLESKGKRLRQIRVKDIDEFLIQAGKELSPRTVAGVCHALRGLFRFLYATGRVRYDLAPAISPQVIRAPQHPPKALPWVDVRRILRGIDRTSRCGKRDYALLLTMSVYGLGAAEVTGLELEDIDWRFSKLRIVRRKTGTHTILPLLPSVAQALASYLRHGRPRHAEARTLFVSMHVPYDSIKSAGAIRLMLIKHARAAGVDAIFLGSHVLRHSHASRQVELGVSTKVLSDILGHRRPESTSAYVRVAVKQLRRLALPVPR